MQSSVLDVVTASYGKGGFGSQIASLSEGRPGSQIICASILSVDTLGGAEPLLTMKSFTREAMSERAIVNSIENELDGCHELVTYGGRRSCLSALVARAAASGASASNLGLLLGSSFFVTRRHVDLEREIFGRDLIRGARVEDLCGSWGIPHGPNLSGVDVADLVTVEAWEAISESCESRTVATWLALQHWRGALSGDPDLPRRSWQTLSKWIVASTSLTHLQRYVGIGCGAGGSALGTSLEKAAF